MCGGCVGVVCDVCVRVWSVCGGVACVGCVSRMCLCGLRVWVVCVCGPCVWAVCVLCVWVVCVIVYFNFRSYMSTCMRFASHRVRTKRELATRFFDLHISACTDANACLNIRLRSNIPHSIVHVAGAEACRQVAACYMFASVDADHLLSTNVFCFAHPPAPSVCGRIPANPASDNPLFLRDFRPRQLANRPDATKNGNDARVHPRRRHVSRQGAARRARRHCEKVTRSTWRIAPPRGRWKRNNCARFPKCGAWHLFKQSLCSLSAHATSTRRRAAARKKRPAAQRFRLIASAHARTQLHTHRSREVCFFPCGMYVKKAE